MRAGQAFVAGVKAGVAMTVLQWLARTFMGMSANIEMIWGTMFLPNSGGAWLASPSDATAPQRATTSRRRPSRAHEL